MSARGMNATTVPSTRVSRDRAAHGVRRLTRYGRPHWRRAVAGVLAMLVATAASLAAPYLAKLAIDDAIGQRDTGRLIAITAMFVVTSAIGFAAVGLQTMWIGLAAERTLSDLRRDLFSHLQGLELGFYERTRTGVLVSRLTNDVEALQSLVVDGLTTAVAGTLGLIGAGVILVLLDARLALVTMLVFPLMALATALFRRTSSRAYRRMREALAGVNSTLQEDLSGIKVLQAYRREEDREANFRSVNDAYRKANQTTVISNALYFPSVEFIAALGTAIVFGYGGYLAFDNSVEVGTLVAFAGYLSNFFDPVQQLSQLYNTFLAATAALDKICGVFDVKSQLTDREGAREIDLVGHVRFVDADFGYDAARPVLEGLNLDIAAGSTVALVGHTGAGKSTIAKLLARFYDPTHGSVEIDGNDLRDLKLSTIRAQVALVPQDSFLFSGSVHDNIAYGRPDASRDDVRAAASAIGADEFIQALPEGYDTQINERGSRLSIGQRQLVAFARALVCNPRLLILDEATSSVDLETEHRIEEALDVLLEGRTSIVIAHRLSTIREADLIIVLDHGRVVEQGTHAELLAIDGRYRALYADWAEVT